jgi:hypothetical protein
MDLADYAVLVFDLAPDTSALQGIDLSNFSISFNDMSLKSSRLVA